MTPGVGHSLFVAAWVGLGGWGGRGLGSDSHRRQEGTEVILWTRGASGRAANAKGIQLALAGAVDAPAGVPRIPDAAYLRRSYPKLQHVTMLGDGPEPGDTAALAGLRLT